MILVTGATGTIGRPLVNVLAATGYQVRALARHTGIHADHLPAGVESVRGDVSRPETIVAALHGVTTLFIHPRAVGADAAFAGKSFLWAVGALGDEGPAQLIDLYIDELRASLGQIGAKSPAEARSASIHHAGAFPFTTKTRAPRARKR